MLSAAAVEWLESRGLDPELAEKLGLDSSRSGDGGEVVVWPYCVGNDILNHKHRVLPKERMWQDGGAPLVFWNYNAIVDPSLADQPLIITEGELDAMTALQCGYQRTVSVPNGAPKRDASTEEQARKYPYLDHAKSAVRECREIILATDGDGPGQALMNDLSVRLGKARCKWVRYPRECKDLNDTLLRYGERGVHEVFRRAEWCRVDGIYRMSDLPPYPVRDQYSTGMEWLNRHYRVRVGDLCVITGVPGHGKSTFVNDVLCRMVVAHKWRVAIASFEQHPQADHKRALREWYCGMPILDDMGRQLASDGDIAAADEWIDEHFLFIVPDDDDLANLEWCLEKCAAAVVRFGARIVSIDPWNELDHSRPPDLSLTEYTGRAIKEFKRLARSLDAHVIVVAHPTKMSGGECPGLYSISDSAHWANKPDVGIVVWKPDSESERAEIRVVKSRYHDQIGRPGKVPVIYNTATRRFEKRDEPAEVFA